MRRVSLLPVLVPVLFVALLAVPMFYAWVRYQEKVEQYQLSEDLYVRLNRIAGSNIESTADREVKELLAAVTLGSDTPAIVGAGLQTRLRELAAQHGLEVIQLAELELPAEIASVADQPQRIGVQLDVSGSMKGIHAFLSGIESQKPWLFVDDVRMQSGFQEDGEAQSEPPMQMSIDVWGLRDNGGNKVSP